jgi:hypothetical protein
MRDRIKNSSLFKRARGKFVRKSSQAATLAFLIFVFLLISTADYGAERRRNF